MPKNRNLSRLSESNLDKLIRHSSVLEGDKALAFFLDLQRAPLYQSQTKLQITHATVLLSRMRRSLDSAEVNALSEFQEALPNLRQSQILQEIYSQGLVIQARKDPAVQIHGEALNKLHRLPAFALSQCIQLSAGELFLESIANCNSAAGGLELMRSLRNLPLMKTDPQLKRMFLKAEQLVDADGREPVVKIDLNQKLAGPLRALRKVFGLGDYRMRVGLSGSPRYKQVVLRVPALNEKSARRTAESFMDEFMGEEVLCEESSSQILDVFPPGSLWESGRHPVLQL